LRCESEREGVRETGPLSITIRLSARLHLPTLEPVKGTDTQAMRMFEVQHDDVAVV
jgi:hypothetical protein